MAQAVKCMRFLFRLGLRGRLGLGLQAVYHRCGRLGASKAYSGSVLDLENPGTRSHAGQRAGEAGDSGQSTHQCRGASPPATPRRKAFKAGGGRAQRWSGAACHHPVRRDAFGGWERRGRAASPPCHERYNDRGSRTIACDVSKRNIMMGAQRGRTACPACHERYNKRGGRTNACDVSKRNIMVGAQRRRAARAPCHERCGTCCGPRRVRGGGCRGVFVCIRCGSGAIARGTLAPSFVLSCSPRSDDRCASHRADCAESVRHQRDRASNHHCAA